MAQFMKFALSFETATLFETPGWTKELVDWFNRSVEEESHHPRY